MATKFHSGKKKRQYDEPARTQRRLALKRKSGEPRSSGFDSPLGRLAIHSMDEVAKIMGIHKSRVHQLERMALFKIRKAIKETGL